MRIHSLSELEDHAVLTAEGTPALNQGFNFQIALTSYPTYSNYVPIQQ